MAFKESIVNWNDGVNAYLDGDYEEAVDKFESIEDPSARIYFNTACAYLRLNKIEAALMSLNETVKKDQHLAIGHFHRGLQQVKLRRYDAALKDFEDAVQKMRGTQVIDYTQLGMTYKLFTSEIMIGKAVALSRLGRSSEAEEVLLSASQETDDDESKRQCVAAIHKLKANKGPSSNRRKTSLKDEEWFHEKLPREDAETLLHNKGDFLVRESRNRKTNEVQYVLSVYWQGYRHIIILQDEESYWKFEGESFPTVEELVNYQYKSGQQVTKRSRAMLLTPVPKANQSSNNSLELSPLPESCIFHPPKELIANLEKRNYLGKAKVITSASIREKKKSAGYDPQANADEGPRPPRPQRAPPVLILSPVKATKNISSDDNAIGSRNALRPPPSLPSKSKSLEDISNNHEAPPPIPTRPASNLSISSEDSVESRKGRRSPAPSRKPQRNSDSSDDSDDRRVPAPVPRNDFDENSSSSTNRTVNKPVNKFKFENELSNALTSRFGNRNVQPAAAKKRNSAGDDAPPRPPLPRRK